MEIALINGSPKVKDSASGYLLEELKKILEGEEAIISEYFFRKPKLDEKETEKLTKCSAMVFAFPTYVDGIPSHLVSCLSQLEQTFSIIAQKDIKVYAMVNCGFYEGRQNKLPIEILENWCLKSGLKWGQGIGIGAGGMLQGIKNVPMEHGPKKNLGKALKQLASNILRCTSEENIFITANFPRILYKLAAEMGWRKSVKENGLKRKDLFTRK